MIRGVIEWFGAVASGSEDSPLAPNSQLSELLRVMQFAIAAGLWYLINQMRKTRHGNDFAHDKVMKDIQETKKLAETNFSNNRDLIQTVQGEIQTLRNEVRQVIKS